MPLDPNTYFANLDEKLIGEAVFDRVARYERYVRQVGLYDLWRAMNRRYHGRDDEGFSSHGVGTKGDQDEFVVAVMNHFRLNIEHYVNLATQNKAAPRPVAQNDDFIAAVEADQASALLEWFKWKHDVDDILGDAVEYAALYGAGWTRTCWNPRAGELVHPAIDPQQLQAIIPGAPAEALEKEPVAEVRKGDARVESFSPIDVIVDPRLKNTRSPWHILRCYDNKFDLAARFAHGNKELAKQIIEYKRPTTDTTLTFEFDDANTEETDIVPYYELWHEKTEACPEGRLVVVLTKDLVLKYGDLSDYEEVTIRRLSPGKIKHTPFGWTPAFDMLAPQEVIDTLGSIALSNARAFGGGIVLTPKGSDIESADLSTGQRMLSYQPGMGPDGGKPSALQLPHTPQEVYVSRNDYIKEQSTLIGVNDVVKGDPQASLKSGNALAMVQAQSVTYSMPFQENIRKHRERVYTDLIMVVADNLEHEWQIPIVGEDVASMSQPFTGKDLQRVKRVRVESVNPMSMTVAGRYEMASTIADRFPDRIDPEQFLNMVWKGRLDPLTDAPARKKGNIKKENELLARGIGPVPKVPVTDPTTGMPVIGPDGKPVTRDQPAQGQEYVVALVTDDPMAHILEHLSVLDDPTARRNPKVVQAVLDHIDEHLARYADLTLKSPGLLQVLNLPPLQAALPPQMPMEGAPEGDGPPPKGGKGGPAPKPGGKEAPSEAMVGAAVREQVPNLPQMPKPPPNPVTGASNAPPTPQ